MGKGGPRDNNIKVVCRVRPTKRKVNTLNVDGANDFDDDNGMSRLTFNRYVDKSTDQVPVPSVVCLFLCFFSLPLSLSRFSASFLAGVAPPY
jgi:hypothetical protein